jgi:hypothetical protein
VQCGTDCSFNPIGKRLTVIADELATSPLAEQRTWTLVTAQLEAGGKLGAPARVFEDDAPNPTLPNLGYHFLSRVGLGRMVTAPGGQVPTWRSPPNGLLSEVSRIRTSALSV